jgi:outer membrane protein OmpA-like peptidoglycan-associated protein
MILNGCSTAKTIPERKIRFIYQDLNSVNQKELDALIKDYSPAEDAFVAVQRIAAPYIDEKNWSKAIKVFERYKSYFPEMKNRFDKIIDLLKVDDDSLPITRLENINSESYSEYIPVPSLDGKIMYFCGNSRPDGMGNEDIFYSIFLNNEWQTPKLMPNGINTISSEAPLSISADGNKLVIFGNYDDSYGNGDMWYVEKTENGWSKRIHFPEPINSKYFDADGSFTPDGKAFLFASTRPGGIGNYHEKKDLFHGDLQGNFDIWVCIKTENGWSEPINLGSTINTPYADRGPFLHSDGKTLYFSSDGHYGLGFYDVFKSVRLSDTSWTEWSEPVNLGKTINTVGTDNSYKIIPFGDIAYYSSGSKTNPSDIYSITLPKKAKPELFVVTISGKVVDEKGEPLSAKIKWENIENGDNLGILESNPQNGEFFIVLPVGKNYSYYAEKSGYYPITKNIDLKAINENRKINIDITLISQKTIEEGKPVVLNNIFFDYNKFELKSESYSELNRIVELFKTNSSWLIQINGHTDSKGDDDYNMKLSKNRAQSVVDYIISKGIDKSRINSIGYGKTSPVASNDTEEGREHNRRVEFSILKK